MDKKTVNIKFNKPEVSEIYDKIELVRHKTVNSIIESVFPDENIDEWQMGCNGFDKEGDVIYLSFNEVVQAVEQDNGMFGFADTKKNQIHYWFREDVQLDEMIGMFAHEYGHFMPETIEEEEIDLREEIKAECYRYVATAAFWAAKSAMKLIEDEQNQQ